MIPSRLQLRLFDHSLLSQDPANNEEGDKAIKDRSCFAFIAYVIEEFGGPSWNLRILIVDVVAKHSCKEYAEAVNSNPVPRLHVNAVVELEVYVEKLVWVSV